MEDRKLVYLNVGLVSAAILCFEILATRIASVIFVDNFAFIILSLAILGLGLGGIFSYYTLKPLKDMDSTRRAGLTLSALGLSVIVFFLVVTQLEFVTQPFVFLLFLFMPFFMAGVFYAIIFRENSAFSFRLYASDLAGAVIGCIGSIFILNQIGGSNGVLLSTILILIASTGFLRYLLKKKAVAIYAILFAAAVFLFVYGDDNQLGTIPIGNFPEKDFHHVYSNVKTTPEITDSRWSIYGRADLVQYSHQDVVKQLFIDGAAGSQMLRFSGYKNQVDPTLAGILYRYSTTIPLLLLKEVEKNSMLVIGPGGGKEVLTGLLLNVEQIVGIEVNPDFIEIVKDHSEFNGGIYTDFLNIKIEAQEGRHYVKKTERRFDLVVMALPSTEQLQNIGGYATNENFLLTVEAIRDYLEILNPEGRLVLSVHNRWELMRLLVSTLYAFEEIGIRKEQAPDHFLVLENDYTPTIVIKKRAFNQDEITHNQSIIQKLPEGLPAISFQPFSWQNLQNTPVNQFLSGIKTGQIQLQDYIDQYAFDITPCHDESPYFYKIKKGVPNEIMLLLYGTIACALSAILLPLLFIKKKPKLLGKSLIYFACLGLGFMIIEVNLFQKLILYLGSPTISLAILLSSLLLSMGIGSFSGNKIFNQKEEERIQIVSLLAVFAGGLFFYISQAVLNSLLEYALLYRAFATALLILPFGFLLGILFPSCIKMLNQADMTKYVPWMYGINGIMSVSGSILAVVLSILLGFTPAFFIGLSFYLIICGTSFKL